MPFNRVLVVFEKSFLTERYEMLNTIKTILSSLVHYKYGQSIVCFITTTITTTTLVLLLVLFLFLLLLKCTE